MVEKTVSIWLTQEACTGVSLIRRGRPQRDR
jgi:hypothetical protein